MKSFLTILVGGLIQSLSQRLLQNREPHYMKGVHIYGQLMVISGVFFAQMLLLVYTPSCDTLADQHIRPG